MKGGARRSLCGQVEEALTSSVGTAPRPASPMQERASTSGKCKKDSGVPKTPSNQAITYVLGRLEIELSKKLEGIDGDFENMRRTRVRLETELRNLAHMAAGGSTARHFDRESPMRLPSGRALLERLNIKGLSNCWAMIVSAGMVPRARIGLATPAFSGPRSTNELPRHGNDL